MKTNLKKELNKLNRVEFIELRHALDFAEMTRSIKKDYNINDEEMSVELEVTKDKLKEMYCGSYRWDIMMWSKLQDLEERLHKLKTDEVNQKIK